MTLELSQDEVYILTACITNYMIAVGNLSPEEESKLTLGTPSTLLRTLVNIKRRLILKQEPTTDKRGSKEYKLYYEKYNLSSNSYISINEVVVTDDIFHYIGKMIYQSMEDLRNIRWVEMSNNNKPTADQEN